MKDVHRLTLLSFAAILPIAVAVAVPILEATRASAVTRRDSWCPSPEMRADREVSLAPAQLSARLREIRERFHSLHEGELFDSPDEAQGPVAELDRMLMVLISDAQLAAAPIEEAAP